MGKILNIKGELVEKENNPYLVQLREKQPESMNADVYFLLKSYLKNCFPQGFLVYACKVDKEETCTEILKTGLVFGRDQGLDISMPRVFDSKSKYASEGGNLQGDWSYLFNSLNQYREKGNNVVLAVFERVRLPYMEPIPANFVQIKKESAIREANIFGYISDSNKFHLSEKFVNEHPLDTQPENE